MRFKKYLEEVFNSPSDFKMAFISATKAFYEFHVSGIEYQVVFYVDEPRTFVVQFASKMNGDWDFGKINIGTKNAISVLTNVVSIMKDFINRREPENLVFDAEEPSRRKLYDSMLKKYTPSGYSGKSFVTGSVKTFIISKTK